MADHAHSNPPQPRPHVGVTKPGAAEHSLREKFDGHELAIVLSHYDLGALESLREYPRGSRKSPKVRVKSQHGEFLLKRRASGQDDPFRVAFAHELQLLLAQRGFPVPGIVGTLDNNSMLHINGRTYEIFNYIHGTRFDHTPAAARKIGETLGTLHAHLAKFRSRYEPPVVSYHNVTEIDAKIALLAPAIFSAHPRVDRTVVSQTNDYLRRCYHDSANRVNTLGFRSWPRSVVHGDWHPGNLLFRHGEIVAVLDFDSARMEPRIIDVSNAVLQFSMLLAEPEDPSTWPDGFDAEVIRSILSGYDECSGHPLSPAEKAAIPWLMIEALVIESIVPIAATGSFARIPGSAFLHMIQRKVKWIRTQAEPKAAA